MKVDVGVIGAGWVAYERHLASIRRNAAAHVVAVYDRDAVRAAERAPSDALATDDLGAFFDRHLDLVIVATPPWLHHEHVLASLQAGAHVLCEKPLGMNLDEATEMYTVADRVGRVLCPVHNFLWSRAVAKAAAVGSGDRAAFVTATQLSSDDRRLPTWSSEIRGGLLFDEIPHMLYCIGHLGQGHPAVVDVRVDWQGRVSEPGFCDVALDVDGVPARLTTVFGTPLSEWHVTRIGATSVVDVDLFRDVCVSTGSDGEHTAARVLALSSRVAAGHFAGFAASGLRMGLGRQFWGHDALIAEMIDCIRHARATASPCRAPVHRDDALAVVRCSDDIMAAIGRG